MTEYAQAIFDEAGQDLIRVIEFLDQRTCEQLRSQLMLARRWTETIDEIIPKHTRTVRALVSLDAEHALANFPGVRRRLLQEHEDLHELVETMKR